MLLLLGYPPREYDEPYQKCIDQITKLKDYLSKKTSKLINTLQTVAKSAKQKNKLYTLPTNIQFRCRKKLSNNGKIYALDFSKNTDHIVTVSQGGFLTIADTLNLNKLLPIRLHSAWPMSCAYSPNGKFAATGGLNNLCEIFDIAAVANIGPEQFLYLSHQNRYQYKTDLHAHEGYVSAMEYVDDTQIITASGDATCILWDIKKETPKAKFVDHTGDVECISIHPNRSMFVSGSIDVTAKLWDIRCQKKAVSTFKGHETDLNCCKWFPNGYDFIFATGSDDSTVRLWDSRTRIQLNEYGNRQNIYASVMSVDFSKSGYYVFVGYDEQPFCFAWNTMTGEKEFELEHPTRVSCVQTSPDGYQIATGCWDKYVRVWSMHV